MCAETLEELLATGENQDLHPLRGVREDVEHQPHPLVVGKHQRIVQDHGGRRSLVNQHFGEGQANEDGDLLLSTHAQAVEAFLVSRVAGHPRDVHVLADADFSVREEHLKVRMDAIDDWGDVAFFGIALGGAKRFGQEVKDLDFAYKTVESQCRLFKFMLRVFDGFVDAGAIVNLDALTQADALDS